MEQWLWQRTSTQRTWVQLSLVPICVTGGSRKDIQPKLFLHASKSPSSLSVSTAIFQVDLG